MSEGLKSMRLQFLQFVEDASSVSVPDDDCRTAHQVRLRPELEQFLAMDVKVSGRLRLTSRLQLNPAVWVIGVIWLEAHDPIHFATNDKGGVTDSRSYDTTVL